MNATISSGVNRALVSFLVGLTVVVFCLVSNVVDWVVVPSALIIIISTYAGMKYLTDEHFPYSIGFFTWFVTGYSLGIAPVLNVYFDYYVSNYSETYLANGWANIVFNSTIVSLAFVILLFMLEMLRGDQVIGFNKSSRWSFNMKKLRLWGPVFLILTAILQVYVYHSAGGVLNYMDGDVRRSMEGAGKLLMISEAFPVLVSFIYAAYYIYHKKTPSLFSIFVFVVVFIAIKMYFGGLRGSRSNIIWALFWLIGIIHVLLRPLRLPVFIAFAVIVFAFSGVYSLYKTHGQKMITEDISWDTSDSSRYEGNASVGLLLEDFSRSGVQAVIVDQYFHRKTFEPAWGSTYIHAIFMVLPSSIKNVFTSKVEVGTDLLYGVGSYDAGYYLSSRVYGFVGEAVMNFTPFLAPLMAIPFYIMYLVLLSYFKGRSINDARILFLPFSINFLFVVLASDLDNSVFFTIKNGVIPFLFLYLITDKKTDYERKVPLPVR